MGDISRFFIVFLILINIFKINCRQSKQLVGEDCNVLGTKSGVYCISETNFKLTLNDSRWYYCQNGYVCANDPHVCVNDKEPACRTATCGQCSLLANSTCVSEREYVDCINGIPGDTVRKCQATRPICSLVYENGVQLHSCTNLVENATCSTTTTPIKTTTSTSTTTIPSTTTTTIPYPPTAVDECIEYGRFPVTADPTCKKYYYCYWSHGELVKAEFVCMDNTIYDPQKGKCVASNIFQCIW